MRIAPLWVALAASLPCLVPPTSFAATVTAEIRISVGSDDAEQDIPSNVIHLTSSDLELVTDGSTVQIVGMRFPGLVIPAGATIQNAWVQFQVDEVSTDVASITLRAQAADNAATFTTAANDLAGRPVTGAAVGWTPPSWPTVGAAGAGQRTPNLAAVIQEVVSRPGWASGNAIAVIATGSGRRTAEAVDGDAAGAPLLHVEYDAAGGDLAPTLTITAPGSNAMFAVGEAVVFGATASDPEDGDLTAAIAWSSSRDGPIGFGGAFTTSSLSTGSHLLTASVGDSFGHVVSSTRQIEVGSDFAVMVGAGDISECSSTHDTDTAALLDNIPGTVFTLGDNVYNSGTLTEFNNCYGPTWGRHKARTRPATGNHDYDTSNAAGYYAYFGAAAGNTPPNGLYSYDVGAWHVVVLNSECAKIGGCTRTSPQGQWLQADLAAHPNACTLAITHKARFGSGPNGDHTILADLWQLLYEAGADVVLSGHDHDYERFDPQDPSARADPTRGIRQFIVGTGGAGLSAVGTPHANSVISNSNTYGVLKLTLRATSYDWQFVPVVSGSLFSDSGSAACVGPAPPNATLSVVTGGPGSVTLQPPGGTYPFGQVVTVTAVPAPGAGFTGFSGDLSGATNPQALQMNASKAVTASFATLANLVVTTSGPGSVTLSPPGGSYLPGTPVTLTAVPGASAAFSGWGGALSGSTNPQQLTLNASSSVSAAFTQLYGVATAAVGSGSVTLSPPAGPYPSGSTVTVTATPEPGSVFVGWSGDLAGTTNPSDLLVDGAKSVTGTFATLFDIGVTTTGPGSVALEPPGGTYPAGTLVSVTATPDAGALFLGFGGSLTGTVSPQVLTVDSQKALSADFALPSFTLVVTTEGVGTIAVSPPTGPYPAGTIVTLTATPGTARTFLGWGGDASGSDSPLSLLIDADKSVTGTFSHVSTGTGCGIGPELALLLPLLGALRRRRSTLRRRAFDRPALGMRGIVDARHPKRDGVPAVD